MLELVSERRALVDVLIESFDLGADVVSTEDYGERIAH